MHQLTIIRSICNMSISWKLCLMQVMLSRKRSLCCLCLIVKWIHSKNWFYKSIKLRGKRLESQLYLKSMNKSWISLLKYQLIKLNEICPDLLNHFQKSVFLSWIWLSKILYSWIKKWKILKLNNIGKKLI